MSIVEYLARCHCGALTARHQTAVEPSAWTMRECQCSFCRSHGALTTSDSSGWLAFQSPDPARIQRYRFGERTADFLICRVCGVYVGVEIATVKGRFGVLNVRSLRPLITSFPAAEPMDYGDETAETRRLRREARWTPLSADSL